MVKTLVTVLLITFLTGCVAVHDKLKIAKFEAYCQPHGGLFDYTHNTLHDRPYIIRCNNGHENRLTDEDLKNITGDLVIEHLQENSK